MKKSPCRSRKRTALRRCILLLALLALYLLTVDFCFTRSAALRSADREMYLSPSTLIRKIESGKHTFYLCANEEAVVLRRVHFTWSQGWVSSNSSVAASPDNPVPHGISGYSFGDGTEQITYLYGRINSPEVAQLEVRFRSSGKDVPQVPAESRLIAQESFFTGPDGRNYFLESLPYPGRDVVYKVTALDKTLHPLSNLTDQFPSYYSSN